MVKRTIKKKKTEKRDDEMEDPIAGMRSSAMDDSDIEEDRPVADLTDVPAPEIEFEMPNLTPMPLYGVKSKKSQSGLSIAVLNNQIVGLRAVVNKALVRLSQKLIRTRKQLAKQLEKKDNPKLKKKVERISEELDVLKNIPKDDVSKFALLNQKLLTQLPLSPETPLGERCLYRLACEKTIVVAVTKFREEFEDWESTIPTLLQRLGHQAVTSTEKDSNKKKPVKSEEPPAEIDNDSEKPENEENFSGQSEDDKSDADVTDDEQAEGRDVSDVDMGTDSDEEAEETVAKRRALLLGLAGIKEEKSRPQPFPTKRKVVVPSDEEDASEELPAKKSAKSVSNKKEAVSAVTNILQKTINESKLSLAKKAKIEKQPSTAAIVALSKPSLKGMKVSNQSAVKQVKLSDGGEVKFAKTTDVKKRKPEPVANEDSDQSDDEEAPSTFFLSADAPSPADSGEESADDDADIHVNPVPKKGGATRQISSTRERFHQRLEERPVKKQMGNVAKKSFGSTDRNMPSKGPAGLPEELHPSWVAKRLAKEQQSARPQGKKTVFADDDD